MPKKIFLIFSVVFLWGCDSYTPGNALTDAAKSHGQRRFKKKSLIKADFSFWSNRVDTVRGSLIWNIQNEMGSVLAEELIIETENKELAVADSTLAWLRDSVMISTWPELLTIPFYLDHPSYRRLEYLNPMLNGSVYRVREIVKPSMRGMDQSIRLAYVNPETRLLHAIVIKDENRSVQDSLHDQLAVVFGDFRDTDGGVLAHKWQFHGWNPKTGLKDVIGELTIESLTFEVDEFN